MGKVTITIADKDDGGVGIKFDPPVKEITEAIMRAELNKDFILPARFAYATRAVKAFRELNQEMKKYADKSGDQIIKPIFKGW